MEVAISGQNYRPILTHTIQPFATKISRVVVMLGISGGVLRGGVGEGSNPLPPSKIPEAPQNRAKINPIVKTVKNCWIYDANTQRYSGGKKRAVKF